MLIERIRASARAAAWPAAGFAATYLLAVVTPWGRRLDSLSWHGRFGTGGPVREADLMVLEAISVGTLGLVLVGMVLAAGLRGRWRLGLRGIVAVLGTVVSAELLKFLLPGVGLWNGEWHWLSVGSFPSGHAAVAASVSLAVLSISSEGWRRLLVGPLVAGTAVAATATVTAGWHRPADVLASLFLATAWHRALGARRPVATRLRAVVPSMLARSMRGGAAIWWAVSCAVILGAAAQGVPAGLRVGYLSPLVYLCSLMVLLAAVLATIAFVPAPERAVRPRRC